MNLITQFNIDLDNIGKIRKNLIKTISKEMDGQLEYQSLFLPIVLESEKHSKKKRFLVGQSKEQMKKERLMMITAKVLSYSFNNIILSLSPIAMTGNIYLHEYSYTTILPYPCDSVIFYVEKKGSLGGKSGFFVFPQNILNENITEEDIFNSSSNTAFTLSKSIQEVRFTMSNSGQVNQIISGGIGSFVSSRLNMSKVIPKLAKKLTSLPEARLIGAKIANKIGVTMLIIPNGMNTIVQVGEFSEKPKRVFELMDVLSSELKAAYELYLTNQ